MNKSYPFVCIVLLNWNNYEDTRECISSLKNLNYSNYKIILVDNYSTDGSYEKLKNDFSNDPAVNLLRTSRNLGFAGGNNIGITKALEIGCDYVFILNNDTIVDKDILNNLLEVFEKKENVGIATPLIYCQDMQRVWYGGGEFDFRSMIPCQWQYIPNGITKVEFVSGCAMLIPSAVLKKVGLFDERFFLSGEDADLCVRMLKAGYNMYINPDAILCHKVGASTGGSYSSTRIYFAINGLLILRKKYLSFKQRLLTKHLIARVISQRMRPFLKAGNYRAIFSVLKAIIEESCSLKTKK